MNQGDTFTSSAPVQVDLVTGDIGSEYEMRWYSLIPRDGWSNDYYTPVGNSSHQTKVWLYNPGSSPLTVSYDFHGGSSPDGTISVPAHGVALSPHVPDHSARGSSPRVISLRSLRPIPIPRRAVQHQIGVIR